MKVGSTNVSRMMLGSQQVWPMAYECLLVPVWTMGGQYLISQVPAAGGYATPTWTFTIKRKSDGVVVWTDFVTPSNVTLTEYIGGEWVTAQHFRVTSGNWVADDRGRNGIDTSSGTTAPTSAAARSGRYKASYSMTYNGVTCAAEYTETMTQNANNAVAGTGVYDAHVYLNDYDSASDAAPAYESYTRVVAYADLNTPYTFVDGVTGAIVATYNYAQPQYVKTNGFNLASDSWVTFANKTDTGADVTVASRGTDTDLHGRNATITATLASDSTIYSTATIYQSKNERHRVSHIFDSYDFYLTKSSVDAEGETIGFYGYANYNDTYQWDSLAPGSGTSREDQNPTTVTQTEGDSATINLNAQTIEIPANSSGSGREFKFEGSYGGDSSEATVSQSGVQYTYGLPQINFYYDDIPAGGGTVYPHVSFTQSRSWTGGSDTISGTLSQGQTSGTASDGSTFSVSFYGTSASPGTFYSSDGRVTIGTRGKAKENYERNAATDCSVRVSCHSRSNDSSEWDVVQEANYWETTPASNHCDTLSISLSPSSINTAASTTVYVTATASGTETSEYTEYASGESEGGVQTSYSGRSVTLDALRVNGTTESRTDRFTADNRHTLSAATYSVTGEYGDNGQTDTKTATQEADAQLTGTKDYGVEISVGSNGVWAGGGTATIYALAKHTSFLYWESGGTSDKISGSEQQVEYEATLSLEDKSYVQTTSFALSSSSTKTSVTLTHYDMLAIAGTDSVKVMATNPADTSKTAKTTAITATNERGGTAYYGSWHDYGSTYYGDYRMKEFTLNNYNTSGSPAPYGGDTIGYTAKAVHSILQDQKRDVYYYYSSNWAGSHGGTDHNDAAHRQTVADGDSQTITKVYEDSLLDGVVITPMVNWVTANNNATITIASNSGAARDGEIRAANVNGGSALAEHIFQAALAYVNVSTPSLTFPYAGGSVTFTISHANSTWSINYMGRLTDPSVTFSPTSGGSANGTGTTTVTATAEPRSAFVSTVGTATVTPGDSSLSAINISIAQQES